MEEERAVKIAVDYVHSICLKVGSITDVKHIELYHLDQMANDCPPDLLETYESVRKNFRSQWVVTFKLLDLPGQVSSPETQMVCVLDSGEVSLFSAP